MPKRVVWVLLLCSPLVLAQAPDKKADNSAAPVPPESDPARQNTVGVQFLKNLVRDQKAIWTSPRHVRLSDAAWLVPLGVTTGALLATDTDIVRDFPNTGRRVSRSRKISDLGAAALIGGAGAAFVWGQATHNSHVRETGLLSGEALINSTAINYLIKTAAGRERPLEGSGTGRFRQGGSSFPSEHATAAWSVATVVAHEYPGFLTKLVAYGTASAVSATRVTGRKHFPSDVFVGSTLGYLIGRQVYRAHHDPELEGAEWGTFEPAPHEGERGRNPAYMGSTYVPLDSWVYPALDRLSAWGYIPSGLNSLRPWTRMECARLLAEAEPQFPQDGTDSDGQRLYRVLEREFTLELHRTEGGARNLSAELESMYARVTGIAGPPLTDGYHFAQTMFNDNGRPYGEGANAITGFSTRAVAGPFAFYVRGEYQHGARPQVIASDALRSQIASFDGVRQPPAFPSDPVSRLRLLDAYIALNVRSYQISAGQQSLWWGPGAGGAMEFSNNAEPIPMLRISRTSPYKLPGPFRLMGPVRTEFFWGFLGGHQFVNTIRPDGTLREFAAPIRPHPYIHGEKITFKPTPNLELGFSSTTVFGGPGFPLTGRTLLRSYGISNTQPGQQNDPGDRRSGFDFSYRIPGLRKWLVLYNDSFTEDEFSPIAYPRRSAMNPGIYLPQIPGIAKLDFRAEGVYTDIPGLQNNGFYYFNFHYASGYTNNGSIMGSWVGRQGRGLQLWSTYWLTPLSRIQVGYRKQHVNPDFLQGGNLQDWTGRAQFALRADLMVAAVVQYERWAFPALAHGQQSNLMTSFQVTYQPSWRLK